MHFGSGHLLVLAHFTKEVEFLGLRGVWVLLRRWEILEKIKCIFSIAPVGNFGEVAGVFSLRNTHRTLAQKQWTLCLCVRCTSCLAQLGLGTGRRLERPVF